MVEGPAQSVRHGGKIAIDHGQTHAVAQGILPCQGGIGGLAFQRAQPQARHARGKAQAGHAGTASKFQNAVPALRRHGCGQQHRVRGRTVALAGLQDAQALPQKTVIGHLVGAKHQSPVGMSLSLRTMRARQRS